VNIRSGCVAVRLKQITRIDCLAASPLSFPFADVWVSSKYCIEPTRKPAVPQAGSPIVSVGFGSSSSTMNRMMCRGVRN